MIEGFPEISDNAPDPLPYLFLEQAKLASAFHFHSENELPILPLPFSHHLGPSHHLPKKPHGQYSLYIIHIFTLT
jgi:hypothetical protein